MQRSTLLLLLVGLALAGMAAFLVIQIARQASQAPAAAPVPQVALVTAARDIADQTEITADAVAVRQYPANLAPAGALSSPDQAIGRFASGFIPRDGIIVAGQVALSRRAANLSERIPSGRVVIWLPMPDLLASANVLRPGDRVDILLTLPTGGTGGGGGAGQGAGVSTQSTLQNVEVFAIGGEELGRAAPEPTPAPGGQPAAGGQAQRPPGPAARAVGFLVDHQDAVIMKFVKDSGGTIDLAVRSAEEQQIVRTDPVALESLVERFRFRVPAGAAR